MTHHRSTPAVLSQRGFGLIELLVVISIIALFLGLGFAAFSYVRSQADQETAYALLTQALNAETEYKAQTGRVMVDNEADLQTLLGTTAQVNAPGATGTALISNMSNPSSEVFVWQALSLPAAASMLRAAAGENGLDDTDNDGFLELIDPWGNPVEFRTQNPDTFGTRDNQFPNHGAPFLISNGPDGLPGTYSTAGEPDDEASDNVVSFELK
ncbi:MAG: prepilin-type N-terminal cleavage/methylation domain-containing protein [Planctomycetota bacterium]